MQPLVGLLVACLLGYSKVSADDYRIITTKTSVWFTGNINGFSGADEICQSSFAGGENANYVALLKGNPSLPDLTTVYNFFNIEGSKVVTSNINDIFGKMPPSNLVQITDILSNNNQDGVWTGADGYNCPNSSGEPWTSADANDIGIYGDSTTTSSPDWINLDVSSCSVRRKLYCIKKISSVRGDPHFVGFDGCKFDFDGQDGSVFAIYSEKNFQINALFQTLVVDTNNGNWMTKLGIHTTENSFILDPAIGLMNAENGSVLTTAGTVKFGTDIISLTFNGHLVNSLTINTPSMLVKAEVKRFRMDRDDFFINLSFELKSRPVAPHGVLGQTARLAVMENHNSPDCIGVEGKMEDYIVHGGILGTDFTFSTFGRDNYANNFTRERRSEFVSTGSRAMMIE